MVRSCSRCATPPFAQLSIGGTPPRSVTAGKTYAFQPQAADPDGDPLAFGIRNKPAWANFNSANGALTGTPPDSAVGLYSDVEISVIVPVLEEHGDLHAIYREFSEAFRTLGRPFEFVFVVDGGLNGTFEGLKGLQNEGVPVRLIRLS